MHRLALVLLFAIAACGPDELPPHEHPHEHSAPELTAADMAGYWVGHITTRTRDRVTGVVTETTSAQFLPVWVRDGVITLNTFPWCMYVAGREFMAFQATGAVVEWDGFESCYSGKIFCADGRESIWGVTSMSAAMMGPDAIRFDVVAERVVCEPPFLDYTYTFTGRK